MVGRYEWSISRHTVKAMHANDREPVVPAEEQQATGSPETVCPFCGGPLLLIHCELRCLRCHALIEGCCEGDRYIRQPPDSHD